MLRSNLLILCYHGFAIDDEADFNPSMFMRPETFRVRMDFLASTSWPVLPLDHALERLAEGDLPSGAIVITADDGWHGTVTMAESVLRPLSFPLTSYITTHYLNKHLPVSNMMLSYLLWKGSAILSRKRTLKLGGDTFRTDSNDPRKLQRLIAALSESLDARGRESINEALAETLEIDYVDKKGKRLFHLMDNKEMERATEAGVDVQLHGDRHLGGRSLDDEALFKREIIVNREKLSRFASSPLEHFCYPSGSCHARQTRWLQDLGIRSAVTCDSGLNDAATNPLQLKRFLDREDISLRRFAIELAGAREALRRWKGRF